MAAEVFLIQPPTGASCIAVRATTGSYGQQKPSATHFWLRDALDAALAGRPVQQAGSESAGCLVHFPKRPH